MFSVDGLFSHERCNGSRLRFIDFVTFLDLRPFVHLTDPQSSSMSDTYQIKPRHSGGNVFTQDNISISHTNTYTQNNLNFKIRAQNADIIFFIKCMCALLYSALFYLITLFSNSFFNDSILMNLVLSSSQCEYLVV